MTKFAVDARDPVCAQWQADLSRALQIDGRDAELLYRRGPLFSFNAFTALGDLEGQTLT